MTPMQDVFGIYKAQWGFFTQRRETDRVQLGGLPTWRCRVHDLEPSHPQKVKMAWFIVAHPRPGVDYICMICTEHPCIQETVQIQIISHTVDLVCKKHDVATRSSWVNYFSPSLNVNVVKWKQMILWWYMRSLFNNTKSCPLPSKWR